MRVLLLAAMLVLMIPTASAGGPCNGPCVEPDAGAGPDGVHASVGHGIGFGGGVSVAYSTDGQFYVGFSQGITRCWVGSTGVGCVY